MADRSLYLDHHCFRRSMAVGIKIGNVLSVDTLNCHGLVPPPRLACVPLRKQSRQRTRAPAKTSGFFLEISATHEATSAIIGGAKRKPHDHVGVPISRMHAAVNNVRRGSCSARETSRQPGYSLSEDGVAEARAGARVPKRDQSARQSASVPSPPRMALSSRATVRRVNLCLNSSTERYSSGPARKRLVG